VEVLSPTVVRIDVNMEEVHELSLDLLRSFEEGGVPINLATVAIVMSLGRLMSPKPMEEEKMMEWIQSLLHFGGMFFVEGEAN